MSFPITREHGLRYTDLSPEWVREHRPWIEDPESPVEVFAEEIEGGEHWGSRAAEEHWGEIAARAAADPGLAPGERVVRDLDYGDWREPTPGDVEAARRGKGLRRLDWGVRHRGEVAHYGYHDAARRAVHNDEHGRTLAVRDVTPSLWARVGGEA
ncbi:hypothetical protein [Parafrankia sp. FMc2]|uniref:hypothetical protein n=1 Tax=Parafrankia sp. FMc2 TaxID=3233196 RepID=UPI0034D62216